MGNSWLYVIEFIQDGHFAYGYLDKQPSGIYTFIGDDGDMPLGVSVVFTPRGAFLNGGGYYREYRLHSRKKISHTWTHLLFIDSILVDGVVLDENRLFITNGDGLKKAVPFAMVDRYGNVIPHISQSGVRNYTLVKLG